MAYVPDSQHDDVFISYSQADNGFRWVNRLMTTLKALFNSINRDAEPRFHFDERSIRGNDPLDAMLKSNVQNSGVFLIIMSKNWCCSKYCLCELAWFIAAAGGLDRARRRIFVVRISDDAVTGWPEALRQNVAKKFFEEDDRTGHVEPISFDTKDSGKPPSVCAALAFELWKCLEDLRHAAPPPPTGSIVFLSETSRSLTEPRRKLAEDLRREGYQVLPFDREFRHDRVAAALEIPELLRQAILVVQLHSERPIGTEEFDASFDQWLKEQAINCKKTPEETWLRWRRQGLKPEEISDLKYRELLFENDVVAEDEAQLTTLVLERLRGIEERARANMVAGKGRKILVRSKDTTKLLADELSDVIEEFEKETVPNPLEAEIVHEQVALETVEEQLRKWKITTVGYVVVYGDLDEVWAQKNMRECRRLALKRHSNAPVMAVYVGPPDNPPRPQTTPGRFEVVRHDQLEKLRLVLKQASEVKS